MTVPDGQPKYNDLVDVAIERAKIYERIQNPLDGSVQILPSIDSDIIWCSTGLVNSTEYGIHVFEIKEWERQAKVAFSNMTEPRARQYAEEILALAISYRRAVDAKASESLRDRSNSQSTYVDKINHQKTERIITAKGEGKKSLYDALMGREGTKEAERD